MIPEHTIILTLDQIMETADYYVKLLRLQDWNIDYSVVRGSNMGGAMGRCNWTCERKRASIQFLEPNDHSPEDDPLDMEHVLVHELLHVSFAAADSLIQNNESDRGLLNAIENHIDALAWAFVTQRRGARHKFSWE